MDDVVKFVREYLKLEHHARVAALSEQDKQKALAAIRLADEAYAADARAGIQRPDEIGDEQRDRASKAVERELFLVREYGGGKLYMAIVGEPWKRPYGTAFGAALFITRERGEPKIVARYLPCPDCDASGAIGGKPCRDCKGSGWSVKETGKAMDLGKLGAPTAVQRFKPPAVDRFAAAYNA